MTLERSAYLLSVGLWVGVALSLMAWILAGYPSVLCTIAVLPLLTPLPGLIRKQRRTFAWATLLAAPYLAFALTELLANPAARWVAGASLLLVFAWFCATVLYLRATRVPRG